MPVMLRKFLQKLVRTGTLDVYLPRGRAFRAGDGDDPYCAIRFADDAAPLALTRDPELALGELYMDGRFDMARGDIFDLLRLAAHNLAVHPAPAWMATLQKLRARAARLRPANHIARARANAVHHYDLDARFYRLFLDGDLQYSCAYFATPDLSLEAAQLAKKRHIAAKLLIEPGQRALDIGCGWGGMALYLAGVAGAKVTGVTLAKEQWRTAQARALDNELTESLDFRLEDYRQTQGRFDRIVSVGMFEHVGAKDYPAFFAKIAALLASDGVALLHTIAQPGPPVPTNPWITRYIFPGGHIPALSEITPAIEQAGLIIADLEVLRLHYALTLAQWRVRFQANRATARAWYGERFCRMWEFYLAGAECAFRIENEHVLQFQLVKSQDAVPIARDYIGARETRLAAREQAFAVKAFEPPADNLPRVAAQAGFVRTRRIV